MKNRFVVFDFDGVVCDSTDECMVTSWNAWERWNNRPGYRTTIDEFSRSERDSFRALRPFVRGAGEYYVLRRCLQEQRPIRGFSDYERECQSWQSLIAPFKKIFYQERERLRADDLSAWIKLHPIWPEVILLMKQLIAQQRAYIATLKDGESVCVILNSEGIKVPSERLFDQSQISNKMAALEEVSRREAALPAEITFVDDNATHLIEPARGGYTCYLTAWGDTPDDYLRLAKENGIPTLSLDNLPALLKSERHDGAAC